MVFLINVLLLLVDANQTLLALLRTLAPALRGSKGKHGFLWFLCLEISPTSLRSVLQAEPAQIRRATDSSSIQGNTD